MSNKTIFCLAGSRNLAELIVNELKCRGFTNRGISALYLDIERNKKRAHHFTYDARHPAANNPAARMEMSGMVGGALGWIAGIRVFTVPETGLFIAAGACMDPFFSAGQVNDAGAMVDGLVRMGISEVQAKHYAMQVRLGNILISAHTECILEAMQARLVFLGARASDICFTDEIFHRQPTEILPDNAVDLLHGDRQSSSPANSLQSSVLPEGALRNAVATPH